MSGFNKIYNSIIEIRAAGCKMTRCAIIIIDLKEQDMNDHTIAPLSDQLTLFGFQKDKIFTR